MTRDEPERVAPPSVRDHLANERTLLAWIRTALTIIGLGFLIDRLAAEAQPTALSTLAGVGLVVLGAIVAVAGGYSYTAARREMISGTYRPQFALHIAIVGAVVVGAVAVAVYLISG